MPPASGSTSSDFLATCDSTRWTPGCARTWRAPRRAGPAARRRSSSATSGTPGPTTWRRWPPRWGGRGSRDHAPRRRRAAGLGTAPRPVGAGRDRVRLRADLHRRDGRQHRAAGDRRRPGREHGEPDLGGQRLHAHAGRAGAARRVAGGPVRPAYRLRRRRRGLRRRLRAVRPGARRGDPHRGAGAPGRRGSPADPGQPGDPAGVVRAARPGPGHRRVVGPDRRRRGDRPVRRRLAGGGGQLALGVPDQPAGGARGRADRGAARPRDARTPPPPSTSTPSARCCWRSGSAASPTR